MERKRAKVTGNIGIMGGTFDPIHLGHLLAAEEARERYLLERVIFVPARTPPHKEEGMLSFEEHRFMMTVIGTINNSYFTVSRIELDAPNHSVNYTVDTITRFREIFGENRKLFFITGADAILDLTTWKGYEMLLSMCEFIAVTRPGYSLSRLKGIFDSEHSGLLSRISILTIPGLAISSTQIRERVGQGKTIKYLTTSGVEQYILKNKLYLNKNNEK